MTRSVDRAGVMAAAADTGPAPDPADAHLVMGYVSGVFGTRGWIKVHSYTRPRTGLLDYDTWYLDDAAGGWRAHAVTGGRRHGNGVVAHLDGVDDRDAAQRLLRRAIAVQRRQLPELAPGEYYWADLIGMRVVDRAGQELGSVKGLVETVAHDVLEVRGASAHLIPFVRDVYVLAVDAARREIRVDWHVDD